MFDRTNASKRIIRGDQSVNARDGPSSAKLTQRLNLVSRFWQGMVSLIAVYAYVLQGILIGFA